MLNPGIGFILMTMLSLTTGTAFIMWLGEQITERGIGNGMSLLIFTGIVVGLPERDREHLSTTSFMTQQWTPLHLIIILAMMVAVVAFIVLVERGERRIPVQYAKRVVGRRMMGGQSTHLPLKVNAGGVIPGHLRFFAAGLSPDADDMVSWSRTVRFLSGMLQFDRRQRSRSTTCFLSR